MCIDSNLSMRLRLRRQCLCMCAAIPRRKLTLCSQHCRKTGKFSCRWIGIHLAKNLVGWSDKFGVSWQLPEEFRAANWKNRCKSRPQADEINRTTSTDYQTRFHSRRPAAAHAAHDRRKSRRCGRKSCRASARFVPDRGNTVSYGLMGPPTSGNGMVRLHGGQSRGTSGFSCLREWSRWIRLPTPMQSLKRHWPALGETMDHLYSKWLPFRLTIHPVDAPSFERYNEAFSPDNPVVEIYVPVTKKF